MKPTDIMPVEKWVKFENEISEKTGSCANIYDVDGFKIIKEKKWNNKLCYEINHNKKGQTFICAPAHQNMAILAGNTGKGIAQECDAGIVKIVVPIFIKDEFIGAVGCCGLMFENGEVESFMVHKTMEMEDDEIKRLSQNVKTITETEAETIIEYIRERIDKIIADFQNR